VRRELFLSLVSVACAGSATAQANESTPPTASHTAQPAAQPEREREYLDLVQKGLTEFELGNWAEAKIFFARAHALYPNARTLRGLGLTSYELRRYVEAIGFLRQALVASERALTDTMRSQASEILEQALTFIAHYRIVAVPAQVELQVDGAKPHFDADGTLMLDPGAHEIVARAEGRDILRQRIVVEGGAHETLRLELSPAQHASHVVQPAAAPSAQLGFFETRSTAQWVGMSVGAAGVAGLVVGGVFGLVAIGHDSDADPNCEGDRCNREGLAARTAARDAGNVATVAFIAGAALCAAGLTLYLIGDEASPDRPVGQAKLAVAVDPARIQLSVSGRWP
jgi:tetratricopeptide (TPR) repeat protein